MINRNKLHTIGYLMSLIQSMDFDSSVLSLSHACSLPPEHIRKYLAQLFNNKILGSHFSPTPKIETNIDDPRKYLHDFQKCITNGECDDHSIYLIDTEDFFSEFTILPITPIEAAYLKDNYPRLIQNKSTTSFEIKDTADSIPEFVVKKQEKIQSAISSCKKIKFSYKSPHHNNQTTIICSPVSVIQDLTSHILFLKDSENNYYRIDRIKSDIKELQEESDIKTYTPNPYQKYFWGTEYKNFYEPVHVKLKIIAETSNIIEKIKNDTNLRKETCRLYEKNGFYYYEDDILGIQDFRRWLRSYGSSVIVLEPKSLIEDIIDSANRSLSFYEVLNTSE